jgi:hypothetical protein
MTTFDGAPEAPSQRSMNGYVSENNVFSFCERMALVEKNGSILLGKFMWQSLFYKHRLNWLSWLVLRYPTKIYTGSWTHSVCLFALERE